MSPRVVVFTFSLETLADAEARGFARPPGRILQTLLASPAVRQVMVVDAERWIGSIIRHGRAAWPDQLEPERPHVRPHRWRRQPSPALDDVRDSVANLDRLLDRSVRRHGLMEPALLTFDPLLAGFATAEWAHSVTYYGRDDWASYPPRQDWWPAYRLAYEQMRATERAVLAISGPLLDRIGPTGPSAIVPNGIDPAEWRSPPEPPAWFASLPRPILTYVGTIDHRIDEDLLQPLFDMDVTVAVIGPTRDPDLSERLRAAGAVLGVAEDRAEVAAIVHASDVGLIPHQPSALTAAMSPLKLYEYRAGGLPVASVDLPPIAAEARDDQRIIVAGEGPDGFASAVRQAIVLGPADATERMRYIDDTSWAGRHRAALEVLLR